VNTNQFINFAVSMQQQRPKATAKGWFKNFFYLNKTNIIYNNIPISPGGGPSLLT
jgi:hypothetical protein